MSRFLSKTFALLLGLAVAAGVGAGTAPSSKSVSFAASSRALKLGIYDDSEIFGEPSVAFATFERLDVRLIRATLRWGQGPLAVSKRRPAKGADPGDPAYNFSPFDEMMKRAAAAGIKVVVTIVGTPAWANGGKPRYIAPKKMADLRKFARAVALRYSGKYVPRGAADPLPAVRYFLAWNEPNNPVFLRPQFKKVGKNKYRIWSPAIYAKICNAIFKGVHSTKIKGEKVACGVTAPRGNNRGRGVRPSVSPLAFMRGLKKHGAHFDAYAHHPYYGNPTETPTKKPPARTAVTLGNIGALLKQLKRLYGGKKHLWITEYGYQTKPPDPNFGVSWKKQAKYLAQAYQIARRNPRIDMLLWFLLRDEKRRKHHDGWQSGLMTVGGKKKPSFKTFGRLERRR